MDSPTLLLLLAVLLVIVGFITGALAAAWYYEHHRSSSEENVVEEEDELTASDDGYPSAVTDENHETVDEDEIPDEPAAEIAPEPAPVVTTNPHPDHVAVARLYRECATGAVAVEMHGDFYQKSDQIPASNRGEFEDLLRDTLNWNGDKPAARPLEPAPTTPNPVAFQTVQPVAAVPVKVGPPKPPAHPHSMLEQIDAILQKLVEFSPYREVGLRVVEDRREGVVVWLGFDRYVGIDQVPDPAAKDLIRQAVARWEAGEKI